MMKILLIVAATVAVGSCQLSLAGAMAQIKAARVRSFFDVCALCERGVDQVKNTLLRNETVEQSAQRLEVLCFGNQACIQKVEEAAQDIEEASPQEVCATLHLCQAQMMFPFTGPRFCHLCERVAGFYLHFLTNETLSQVEQVLNRGCHGKTECQDSVAKIIAELEQLTPESVCEQFHLCSAAAPQVLLATDKCAACTQKLTDAVSDENLEKISGDLKKLCRGNEACDQKVDELIKNVKDHRAEVVSGLCKLARQC